MIWVIQNPQQEPAVKRALKGAKALLRSPAITSRHHHVERKRTPLEACLEIRAVWAGEIPGGCKTTNTT